MLRKTMMVFAIAALLVAIYGLKRSIEVGSSAVVADEPNSANVK